MLIFQPTAIVRKRSFLFDFLKHRCLLNTFELFEMCLYIRFNYHTFLPLIPINIAWLLCNMIYVIRVNHGVSGTENEVYSRNNSVTGTPEECRYIMVYVGKLFQCVLRSQTTQNILKLINIELHCKMFTIEYGISAL